MKLINRKTVLVRHLAKVLMLCQFIETVLYYFDVKLKSVREKFGKRVGIYGVGC